MQNPPNQPPYNYPPQGPPQGAPFGSPYGVPQGYQGGPGFRPPPRPSGGGGSTVIIILLLVFVGLPVLGGAIFGFVAYRARSAIREAGSSYAENETKIAKVDTKVAAVTTAPNHEACVKAVSDRIAKASGSKAPAPKSLPVGAPLVCEGTSWEAGCALPQPLIDSGAFAANKACSDSTAPALEKLRGLSLGKPYPSSDTKDIDKYAKDADAALADLKAADTAKAPDVIAVATSACTPTPVATFNNTATGEQREIDAFSCEVSVVWVDTSGNVVGRVAGTGSGKPSASYTSQGTLDETQLAAANSESRGAGILDGATQAAKRLEVLKKGGSVPPSTPGAPAGPPKTPTAPAAPPKAATPPKTPAPPATPPKKK